MTRQSTQTTMTEKRDEAVETAVVELLNVAVVLGKDERGRLVAECKMCGQREENHTKACPVPALEEWINPSALTKSQTLDRSTTVRNGGLDADDLGIR